MGTLDFNRGYKDGLHSASLSNPFHKQWKKDKSNKSIHHNSDYAKGYTRGYTEKAKVKPLSLSNWL